MTAAWPTHHIHVKAGWLSLGGGRRRLDLLGRKLGRKGDLDEFEIVGMAEFDMADARRLMNARAGDGQNVSGPLVTELDPAFDDVEHLELEAVTVPAGLAVMRCLGADDMRHDLPAGHLGDAEVAVLEERAQPAVVERR